MNHVLRLPAFLILILLALPAGAQAPRARTISAVQAQRFELSLRTKPSDKAARGALLTYYYLNSQLPSATAIRARRRHILWFIQNAPDDLLAGSPQATIDAAGHRLADPVGFQQASDAWRSQAARPDLGAFGLANAANFFKLSDKEFAAGLLDRALQQRPADPGLSSFLGTEYAMAIMGVTMVNKNGLPMSADPRETQSAFARQAREALDASGNAYLLAGAGYALSFQGSILRATGQLGFDAGPLAESVLQRAVSLDPNNKAVAQVLEEHHQIQSQVQAARAGR